MEAGEARWGHIPIWSGQPEAFSHFIHEVKWTLSSSKKEERALLAARIVRKALQSGQPTLVQLMYKLNPDDFSGEQDVQKLIRFLEDSPLNRQALPDAGQKIGAYYRRLSKRPNESVPAFLVREDKVHDEMLKALQRLLREKELDFDGYNMTLPELKRFVGMEPEASLFYGDDANEADTMDQEEETEEEQSQRSSKTAAPSRDGVPFSRKSQSVGPSEEAGGHDKPQQRGKDVLELLMEKGLIPLAALDVIRGWLLLEMATPGEEDRRLIRAATRNKLGYYDIRSALLSMYEEKHHGNPFQHQRGGGKGGVFSADVDTTSWDEFEPYDPGASSSSHDQTNLYGTMEGQSSRGIDKCIWIFKNKQNKACGRVGTHVDDFLLCGDLKDPEWIAIREQLQNMYSWSPWKRGSFTFAGVKIMQLQDFSIKISQEHYCNDLRPVPIDRERERPKDDSLTPSELTQARGLLMKAQWRSVQTAPQYQARIGIAASSLAKPTLAVLKEANAIMKELKKTSQEGLIFHSFPEDNLCWKDVIFVHFGDAARGNRPCGGDTGGFITAVASPKILQGIPAKMSILDYRSWKLDRPVRGSNGSEAQALYVTEDAGWKMRLMWALAHGERLMRGCADDLAASVESLLVMDSRGCYDALSNSDSPLLGMNSAKTGVELMAVQRGIREGTRCYPTWTLSDMNLSDCMTKVSNDAFRVWALYERRKTWIIRFNEEFVAARKAQRLRRQQGRAPHARRIRHQMMSWKTCGQNAVEKPETSSKMVPMSRSAVFEE